LKVLGVRFQWCEPELCNVAPAQLYTAVHVHFNFPSLLFISQEVSTETDDSHLPKVRHENAFEKRKQL